MALTGLRPLKETNTLGNSPTHYATMNGAYDIYVQDQYAVADGNQTYYGAKWLKLAAGTYTMRMICDDSGTFKLDGNVVATGTNGGDWVTPVTRTFTVAANGVYRWDIEYTNVPAASPSYVAYELALGGVIIEVSRAQDFIGDLKPIPDSALGPKPPYDSDIRLSYPVFLPKPDWQYGVMERLEWLTDVLVSESGAEQRRKLRQYPRRSLEASFLGHGVSRGLIENYLVGVGQGYGLVPLWWDETKVDGAYAGSVDLFGDIRRREFFVNDVVLIRRATDSIFDYELNIVTDKLNNNQLVLRYGLQKDLPKGSTVTPIRVGRVLEQMNGTMLTDQVKQYQLRFFTIEAADYTTAWTFPTYARTNLPICSWDFNYKDTVTMQYDRQAYQWDNQVGNIYNVDPGNTASVWEKMSYHIHGRDAMHDFKQNIYKMAGRWKELHVPTGHNEFELSRDISQSAGALVVYRSGYTQYNDVRQATRQDILIELWDGSQIPNTIISTRVIEDEEWLFLSETIPSLSKDDVRRISYMPRSRLDIDAVEINRLTDADGVSTVTLTFKAFVARRNAPPIPIQ